MLEETKLLNQDDFLHNWWSIIDIFLHTSGLSLNMNKMVLIGIDIGG